MVKINSVITKTILFKFHEDEEIGEYDELILTEETNILFYRTSNEWGIVNLSNSQLLKQELTFQPGIIERIQNSIIIDDEIKVKSFSLTGEIIDEKPIDPPSERTYSKNELIYTSPLWGIQKLKIE